MDFIFEGLYLYILGGGCVALGLSFWLLKGRGEKTISESLDVELHRQKGKEVSSEVSSEISLDEALKNTQSHFFGRIQTLFSSKAELSSDDLESLEEILYTSDLGPKTVQNLQRSIENQLEGVAKSDLPSVRNAIRHSMENIFSQVIPNLDEEFSVRDFQLSSQKLSVWMIVGVNGAGKTTTIGKLAAKLVGEGKKVLVAAGDTFRAAADAQLRVWTERADVEIFSPEGVKDPSAVAFDACQMARSRGFDVLLIDTAGRLHTQNNLMEELKKMKRVVKKVVTDGPQETLIVLDANSGQNALTQAKQFHDALDLSGVILTKLDGSAKGGVAVGLACELQLPVRLIGIGEGLDDLRGFAAKPFVDSIV